MRLKKHEIFLLRGRSRNSPNIMKRQNIIQKEDEMKLRKLYYERCKEAMLKFSREELYEAAKRVGAEVKYDANKEEICDAINKVFSESEYLYRQPLEYE